MCPSNHSSLPDTGSEPQALGFALPKAYVRVRVRGPMSGYQSVS
jgi:hypothetical protein